jgi:hypothetical protein
LVLLYPRRHRAGLESQPVGTSTLFEHIEVDGYNIYRYEVEVKGISAKDGFRAFAQGIEMRSACTSSRATRPNRQPTSGVTSGEVANLRHGEMQFIFQQRPSR